MVASIVVSLSARAPQVFIAARPHTVNPTVWTSGGGLTGSFMQMESGWGRTLTQRHMTLLTD